MILTQPKKERSPLAQLWLNNNKYISWQSTLEENKSFGEQVDFSRIDQDIRPVLVNR